MDLFVGFLFTLLAIAHCKRIPLTCKDIKAFVDGHNSRRLKVAQGQVRGQPAAKNMKLLMWDDELAAKAEEWAETFPQSHNPDFHIDSGRFWVGENVMYVSSPSGSAKMTVDDYVRSWFIEFNHYKFHPVDPEDFNGESEVTGHYTQLVWATTMYIGCGISVQAQAKGGWKVFYIVCNYGPAGNFVGSTPYEKGGPQKNLICGVEDCSNLYSDRC